MNPRRGRDRRARGRAHRLAADGRLRERERRGDAVRRRAARCRSGWSSSASCARRASSSSRCRSSTPTAPCCPRRAAVLAHGRAARPRARHRPPLARRDLRRRRRGARGGRAGRSSSRIPSSRRRASRSTTRSRWPRAARCSSAASRRRTPASRRGRSVFEAIRAIGAEHSVLSTDLGQTANPPVEDGLGADGRPAARGRLRRGGGAHDGGREHAAASRGRTREPAPAGDRRPLGRLRLARRRRGRRHDRAPAARRA